MTTDALNRAEKKAISDLKALAKRWPKTLWLFSASGTLCVMRVDDKGEHAHNKYGGIDHDFLVDTIHGIENDGGDW